jgi:hypothetical protein
MNGLKPPGQMERPPSAALTRVLNARTSMKPELTSPASVSPYDP